MLSVDEELKRLIDRCRKPARDAIGRYQSAPYRDNFDPQDIATETAWRARRRPGLSKRSLYSLACLVIIDRLRVHGGRRGTGKEALNKRMLSLDHARDVEGDGDPLKPLEMKELYPRILEWIALLPPATRAVIRHRYLDGETQARTGRITGRSHGRIDQLEREGLRRLRLMAQQARLLPEGER